MRPLLTAIPATALGAIIGWWTWPQITAIAIKALHVFIHDIPGSAFVLYQYLCMLGAALGGVTACALIMSRGPWRHAFGWLLIVATAVTIIWSAQLTWACQRVDGRRLALAIYGLPLPWICLLVFWGYRMRTPHNQKMF